MALLVRELQLLIAGSNYQVFFADCFFSLSLLFFLKRGHEETLNNP